MASDYRPTFNPADKPLVREHFAAIIFQTLAYGVYLVISTLAISLLWKRHKRRGTQRLPLLCTCSNAVLVCVWFVATMRTAAYDFVDVLYEPPFAENYQCSPASIVSELANLLIVLNSDVLMIYRTYVVWGRQPRIVLLPLLMLLAQLGVSIALALVCWSDIIPGRGPFHIPHQANLGQAISLTVLTATNNLYCTCFISWKVLGLGRERGRAEVRPVNSQTPLGRIVVVLAESAALYTAASTASVIVTLTDYVPGAPPGNRFATTLFLSLAFLSPAVIVLRVAMGVSPGAEDWTTSQTHTQHAARTTIQFAPRPTATQDCANGNETFLELPTMQAKYNAEAEEV